MTGRYPDLVGAPGVIRQNPESNWGYFNPITTYPSRAYEPGRVSYRHGWKMAPWL